MPESILTDRFESLILDPIPWSKLLAEAFSFNWIGVELFSAAISIFSTPNTFTLAQSKCTVCDFRDLTVLLLALELRDFVPVDLVCYTMHNMLGGRRRRCIFIDERQAQSFSQRESCVVFGTFKHCNKVACRLAGKLDLVHQALLLAMHRWQHVVLDAL